MYRLKNKIEKLEGLSLLFYCISPCFDTVQWLFKHLALLLDIVKETWVTNSEKKWKKFQNPQAYATVDNNKILC